MSHTVAPRVQAGTAVPGDVVLVFTRQGPQYDRLFGLAEDWTQCGLLKPSIWIDQSASPITTRLVSESGTTAVDVHEELSTRAIGRLRVVSVALASAEEELPGLPNAMDEFTAQDQFRTLAAEANVPFSGGIVVGTLAGLAIPASTFHAGWRFNLVVCPEDAISDDKIGVALNTETLSGAVCACLATAAGLWRWSRGARLDDLKPRGGTSEPEVRLMRSYVRIVDAGRVFNDIADSALSLDRQDGQWSMPHSDAMDFVSAPDPKSTVEDLSADFVTRFGLKFTPLEKPQATPPLKVGILEGIKLFSKTIVKVMQDIPVIWIASKRDKVERRVLQFFTDHTFGSDSSVVLTLRGHSLSGDGTQATGLARINELARLDMPGSDIIVADPALWGALWTVACGLADGSKFPDGLNVPVRGTARLLVTDPDFIMPSVASEEFFANEALPGLSLSPVDAFGADELERCLRAAIKGKNGSSPAAEAPTPGAAVPTDSVAAATLPADHVEEVAAGIPPAVAALAKGPAPVIALEKLQSLSPDQLSGALSTLQDWEKGAHRSESFGWQVAKALGEGVIAASDELADALTIISKGEGEDGPSEDEKKETATFRRFLKIGFLVLIGVLGATVVLLLAGILTIVLGLIIIGVVLLGSGAGAVKRFISFAQRQTRAQFIRDEALGAYWFAFERAFSGASGVAKFCALYWQFLDWATTLSVLVREPWGTEEKAREGAELASLTHPKSMAIGKAEIAADQYQRRVAAAQQVVTTPGWLRAAFERHVRLSTERTSDLLHTTDAADASATADITPRETVLGKHAVTGEPIHSPRSQVCHDAVDRRFAVAARLEESSRIIGDALRQPLDEIFTSVTLPSDGESGASGDAVTTFLLRLVPGNEPRPFPPATYRIPELHPPVEIEVSMPGAVPAPTLTGKVTLVVSDAAMANGERFVLGSHRLDLGESCPLTELTLIDAPSPDESATDREPPSGKRGIVIP
jgi:hypothetical protein